MLRAILLVAVLQVALMPPVVAQVDTSREDRLLKTALEYIENNRKGPVQIQFVDGITGKPVGDSEVEYQQTTHDFVFGTHFGAGEEKMQQLGLEWGGDVWLSWSEVEPVKGVFDFSRPDDTIKWVQQNKQVRLWGRFTDLFIDWNYVEGNQSPWPPAYADLGHIGDPVVFARYKDLVYEFAFNVALRYRGTISAYVTQIEINWPGHAVYASKFVAQDPWTVQQAAQVNRVVSEAIRKADPTAIIILGTSTPWKGWSKNDMDPLQFTKLCLDSGVDFDLVALEIYPTDGDPAFYYDYMQELAKLGKPVFVNELGYPSMKSMEHESSMMTWNWHVFNEGVQALWYKYIFAFAFGMKGAVGVNILQVSDYESVVSWHSWANSMGLYTVEGQEKESARILRQLIANFTTSGTMRTDNNGFLQLRGFAGNYSVHVGGYEPVTVHVSEGPTKDITVSLLREKTPEYNDAAMAVESAEVTLSALHSRDLRTAEAKNLTEAAATEYDLALASLQRWELDAARAHAERSQQLANQALQAEAQYQQQQDYLKFSAVLATIGAIVAVMVVSLVRSRTAPNRKHTVDGCGKL